MPLDSYHRDIDYLRISLTDACNLRCVYCMPENMTFRPRDELLSDAELRRLITLFATLGFRKIRFTGGEPTLRPGLVELVRHAVNTPGITAVGLTTNGVLLDQLAQPLADAGLQTANVSIDSLDEEKFRKLTRWGNLRDVHAGLAAAARAGLRIKLNAVVCRGVNDGEDVVALARLTFNNPWQVRFLASAPFCAGCNRMRLTADGVLRLCLLRDNELNLLNLLRGGENDEAIATCIRQAVHEKPWGHGLAQHLIPSARGMSEIGG